MAFLLDLTYNEHNGNFIRTFARSFEYSLHFSDSVFGCSGQ